MSSRQTLSSGWPEIQVRTRSSYESSSGFHSSHPLGDQALYPFNVGTEWRNARNSASLPYSMCMLGERDVYSREAPAMKKLRQPGSTAIGAATHWSNTEVRRS